ncbi:hypothetical protein Hanom_Chr12g01080311 [Helianthus anomalus]
MCFIYKRPPAGNCYKSGNRSKSKSGARFSNQPEIVINQKTSHRPRALKMHHHIPTFPKSSQGYTDRRQ